MATVSREDALVERVQELTGRLDEIADLEARALADELAGAVVQLYGAGLERIFAALSLPGASGEQIRDVLADDPVVASLMLIHDLYPVGIDDRVEQALDTVRPYLESHGGNVELLGIEDGVARLQLSGSCKGCAASRATLEHVVEQALRDLCPDLHGMEVEGAIEEGSVMAAPMLGERTWRYLDEESTDIARGSLLAAGELVVANVAGTLLAYRDQCASCAAPLSGGMLVGGQLTCTSCGKTFLLPRAGRCLDDDSLQLEPIPLLRDKGRVRVAVAA